MQSWSTGIPVISDEEEAVITRSGTLPRLRLASVKFYVTLASAGGTLSSPYRTLTLPTVMIPDFVPKNSVRKVAGSWGWTVDR